MKTAKLSVALLAASAFFGVSLVRADDHHKKTEKTTTEAVTSTEKTATEVTTGKATDASKVNYDDTTLNIQSKKRTDAGTERAIGDRTELEATTGRTTTEFKEKTTEPEGTGTRARTEDVTTGHGTTKGAVTTGTTTTDVTTGSKTTDVTTGKKTTDVTTGKKTSDASTVSSDDTTINIVSPKRTPASTERAIGERTEVEATKK